MKLDMYAVHDSAVGAYNRPMCFRSRGEALRSFADAVSQEENGFMRHADNYSWWFVGHFDDESGSLIPAQPAERICGARDFVASLAVPSK